MIRVERRGGYVDSWSVQDRNFSSNFVFPTDAYSGTVRIDLPIWTEKEFSDAGTNLLLSLTIQIDPALEKRQKILALDAQIATLSKERDALLK
jgi:hypothetical protein